MKVVNFCSAAGPAGIVRLARIVPGVVIVCCASSFSARGTLISWTNLTAGNWSAATNWSPQQVPTASDDVVINAGAIITVDIPAFAATLAMTNVAATLKGAGPLTAGTFTWSSGTNSTTVYCDGGTISDPRGMDGGALINSGTLTWLPPLFTGNGSIISNTPSGIINLQLTGDITENSFGGASYFYNAGQINASGAAAETIGDVFINTGTVTVSSGGIQMTGGGTNFGTMIANGSALLGVGSGTYYFASNSVLSGTGGFTLSGGTANIQTAMNLGGDWNVEVGTVNFDGASTVSGQSLNIVLGGTANFNGPGPWAPGAVTLDGNLGGTAPVVASGALDWDGGTITGILSCNGGTVNDPGGLDGGELINTGTLTWIPYPYTGNGSIISNTPSGIINLQLTGDITANRFGGASYFYNAGQINGSGADVVTLGDVFINTGTVTVSSGGIQMTGGGTNFGTMIANGSAVLGVGSGTYYFASNSVLSGTGGFTLSGGTANIQTAMNLGGDWNVEAGTVNFDGTSTVSGQNLNIVLGGTANFNGPGPWAPGAVTLKGNLGGTAPVVASGALDWTSGTITGIISCNGGTVNNPNGLDGGELINTGTLTWIPYPYTGNGSIISNAPSGTIALPLIGRAITGNGFGGTAVFYNSGQLTTSGTDSASIADTFINNGTLTMPSGALQLTAGAVFGPASSVYLAVTNLTNFANLQIGGSVVLGGLLEPQFSGITLQAGDSFPLITYASETGFFNTLVLPPQADWKANYGPTVFALDLSSFAAPHFTLGALPASSDTNSFNMTLIGNVGSNYTVEASTDFKSWVTLTNLTTTVSSFNVSDPAFTNSPRRFYRAYYSN